MTLTLVTPPPVEPVTEAQVWAHLRVPLIGGNPVDKDHIKFLTTTARETIDGPNGWLGRALVTQTWDWTLDGFPTFGNYGVHRSVYSIEVPLPPLQEIVSVKYIDSNGVEQTVDPNIYEVDVARQPGRIMLADGASWPNVGNENDAVTVRFVAGYPPNSSGDPVVFDYLANIPSPIKFGLLMIIADMYEVRQSAQPIQPYNMKDDAESRLANFRVWEFP